MEEQETLKDILLYKFKYGDWSEIGVFFIAIAIVNCSFALLVYAVTTCVTTIFAG